MDGHKTVSAPAARGPRPRRARRPAELAIAAKLTRRDIEITLKSIWPDGVGGPDAYRIAEEYGGAKTAAQQFQRASHEYFALWLLLRGTTCEPDIVAEIQWLRDACADLSLYKRLEARSPEAVRERFLQAKEPRP